MGKPGQSSGAPLVFAYLGNPLPNYSQHSLALAKRNYQGPIRILTDRPETVTTKGVDVVDVTDWYDRARFEEFARTSELDALFRGGFWLKAVERFYVLKQYMNRFDVGALFHAELDVLIFDLEGYQPLLDKFGSGCFIPAQRPDRAIASLIYINDKYALGELLTFFEAHQDLGNEMNMLGAFLTSRSDIGHALPSETALSRESWPVTPSSVPIGTGLVDALGFGPWLFGYDPRNIIGSTWNHFQEGSSDVEYRGLRFRAGVSGRRVKVSSPESELRNIRAVHVHSKIFRRLTFPGVVAFYCAVAGFRFRTPITLSTAAVRLRLVRLLLRPRVAHLLVKSGGLVRKVLSGVIPRLVTHSPAVLSTREREKAFQFLNTEPFGKADKPIEFTRPTPEILHSEPRWLELVEGFAEKKKHSLLAEIAVFADALEASAPMFYSFSGQAPAINLISCGKQALFVSSDKRYQDSKHALTFWADQALNNRWSFACDGQLLQPEKVRIMFPNGLEDLYNWAEMGINRPQPSLSAFQAYGTWLFGADRRGSQLVSCSGH